MNPRPGEEQQILSPLSYLSRPSATLPIQSKTPALWTKPFFLNQQSRKCLHKHVTAQSDGGNSSIKRPTYQTTLPSVPHWQLKPTMTSRNTKNGSQTTRGLETVGGFTVILWQSTMQHILWLLTLSLQNCETINPCFCESSKSWEFVSRRRP